MAEQLSLAALLRAQRDLGVALSAETNLDCALALVVEAAIHLAGVNCGGIYLSDPLTGALHLRHHTGLPEECVRAASCLPPESWPAKAVSTGKPLYTRYDELLVPLNDWQRKGGVGALAVIPIIHTGQIIGCLSIGSSRPELFSAEVQYALETLAAQIGSAIARIRAEEELRASENAARALLTGVSRATSRLLAIADLDAAVAEATSLLGEAVGVSRVFIFRIHSHPSSGQRAASLAYEWVRAGLTSGLGLPEYQNLDFHALGLQPIYERLSAGEMVDGSDPALRETLANLPLSNSIPPFLVVPIFARGELWGSIGLEHQDLTWQWPEEHRGALTTLANSLGAAIARYEAETRLRQERDFAELLRDTALALTSSLEVDDVLTRLLEQVERLIPYEVANVFSIEDQTARIVRRRTADPLKRQAPIGEQHMRLADYPLLRRIACQGEICVIPDTRNEPDWIVVPGTEYIRSWLAVPIVNRGQVLGLFGLDSAQPGFYGPEHIRLISPVATQAGIALANARLFASVQSLEQTKSQMIRLASHDLRSPLTRITLLIERLLKRGIAARDPQSRQDLARIREAASHMERLVDQILSLERIEARHRTTEVVDWCRLTFQVIEALRAELDARQHRLSLVCPEELPAIQGDPVQLYYAAYNLLHNAIKYTPARGLIEVRVRLKRIGEQQTLVFEVEDSGIGIPADEQGGLFEPFFRAANVGMVQASGVGLGLTVVKAAVEHHRGRVYCESTPGQGSLFGFWLPVEE
jgi:signal transduction histidine kinase